MSQLTATTPHTPTSRSDRTLWRFGGGFGLAHLVVVLAGFSLEGNVGALQHGTAAGQVQRTLADFSSTRLDLLTYVEASGFLLLVPALVILGRLFGRRTETGRVAALSFVGLGIAFVGATLAVGFAPLTSAAYWAARGADPTSLGMVNDLRNNSYVLQVMLQAATMLALGIAARAEGIMTRWVGTVGIVVGAGGIVATAFAHNAVSMVWMIWWVGVCVLCLRGGPKNA